MTVLQRHHVPSTSVLRFLRKQITAYDAPAAQSIPTRRPFHSSIEPRPSKGRTQHKLHSPNHIISFTNHERCTASFSQSQRLRHIPHLSAKVHFRAFSTPSTVLGRFWGSWQDARHREKASDFRDDDLLPLLGLEDNSGLGGRVLKPSNELKMRCTEFDENGTVVLVSGEYKKHELIAKYSLLPRDLRKIDSSMLPSISIRPSTIIINLIHIRCLIRSDRVLVFDVYGSTDSYAQSLFMYDLEGKLRQKPSSTTAGGALPYEFRALEAVLISVTNGLESEFEGVREPVIRVLRELEEDIDRDKLRHLLVYSKKLSTFEQKARLVRDAIDELLEADDDLAAMYLTEKAQGRERDEENHEEAELLLESYYNVADEICQVSSNLVTSIKMTEEIIRAILDSNRNSLMLLDLKFSVLTLGATVGMFTAALYGMNLKNFVEESDYGFFGISGFCVMLTGVACLWGLQRLRKLQRVRIWHDRASAREARFKARLARRDLGRQFDASHTQVAGLRETVAGIRSRDAVSNWKREQQERIKQLHAEQKQAVWQAKSQAQQQASKNAGADGSTPVAVGA